MTGPGWRPAALWWWLLLWLGALALSQAIPPMQSPDENAHIARAESLSRGQWLLQRDPQQGSGAPVDTGLLRFVDIHMRLAAQPARRLDGAERAAAAQTQWTGQTQFAPISGTGYYLPLVYAPQALGLAAGRALGLGIPASYQLARAATLLACVALLAAAVRRLPPNPLAAAVLLLPMSLFQLLSPTLDGITTCLTVLLLAWFLTGSDRTRPFGTGASAGLAIGALLVAASRIHLLTLLLLPLWVAWRRRSLRDLAFGTMAIAATLAWVLYALHSTVDLRIPRTVSTAQLLQHYARDPLDFVRIVWATLRHDETRNFYLQSFIGNLGWLDTPLPAALYAWLAGGLGLAALASVAWRRGAAATGGAGSGDASTRLVTAACALAAAGLVFFALLITWTPHPAERVGGVQGRYFLVPALVLAHAASGFAAREAWARRAVAWPLLAVFATLSLYALIVTLLGRYH